MIAFVLLLFAWFSAFLGATSIALINRTHWNAVTGSSVDPPSRRWNAIRGGLLLVMAAVLAIVRDGWGMGLLLGPLLIATATATLIALLALRPMLLRFVQSMVSAKRIDRLP